jgi:hypothetical protein
MGQASSYVAPRFPINYWIDAFSFDALRVDFCARPLARIRMSSDLPLLIKRLNSSAVKGRLSSRTRGWPASKNPLNQRPSRCIRNISTPDLQRIVAANVPSVVGLARPPGQEAARSSCRASVVLEKPNLPMPPNPAWRVGFRRVFRMGRTAGIAAAV